MITLYDTTLRDGTQREGMSLSVEDKLRIVDRLDDLGVHFVEGGFPAATRRTSSSSSGCAIWTSRPPSSRRSGSTRRKDTTAAEDPGLAALLASGCDAICIVGKAWDLHVTGTLGATLEENLAMVSESVAYLKAAGRTVFFDAEHFFDGYAANDAYAVAVCAAAAEAGADAVVLCDTNGGTLPQDVARIVRELAPLVGAPIGIHTHNDAGCAVANALVAVTAGASHVQGTVNGYGERTGNADLTAIIPALVLKMGDDCVTRDQLRLLTEVSHFVAETASTQLNAQQPYVGASAFARMRAGCASATGRLAGAYEHIEPSAVGNLARVVVSELAGRASLTMKARELGIDLAGDPALVGDVLDTVKELERRFAHSGCDASLGDHQRRETTVPAALFILSRSTLHQRREDGQVADRG